MTVKYAELAGFFERLEGTSGRLEMTAILVEMLGKVPKGDVVAVVRLLQGAVAPDWEGLEVGLAEKQILKALAIAQGASTKSEEALAKLERLYHEKGDLGLAAEVVLSAGARKQSSLFASESLTVKQVYATLVDIAKTTGTGSQEGKQRLLSKLLLDSTPLEARFIVRTVSGRLRLGVADMTFLDALAANHLGRGVKSVQDMEAADRAEQESVRKRLERAYDVRSDLAVVAHTLYTGGMEAVDGLEVEVGVPVRPMASERLKTFPEILDAMAGTVDMEYKYDGLRMQVHVPKKGPVRIFSRRLEELTAQFPDVCASVRGILDGADCIIEGEGVALDDEGKLRPFQDVSRRRGRKTDLEAAAAEIPITLFLFDLIAQGGKSRMDLALAERRTLLAKTLGHGSDRVRLSTLQRATDAHGMERFFEAALEDGAEGIMCKDPRAAYKAGSRGFAWVKFKADYDAALADTMDLVAIGAFYGRGRRAGWYGALLMAAYDPATQTWPSVCKLGTGFNDETLKGLKPRFETFVAASKPKDVDSGMEPDVWFEPKVVMEVQAAELTLSPTHRAGWGAVKAEAGFAARFPRFTDRWRDDKSAQQATTVTELATLYKNKGGGRS